MASSANMMLVFYSQCSQDCILGT